MTENLFGIDPYHVLLTATGLAVLVAYTLPRLAFRRPPSASWLLMVFGLIAFAVIPACRRPSTR